MKIEMVHSIIERQYPGITISDIVQFHNDSIDDGEDLLKYTDPQYLDIVSGKRFYKLKSNVINVTRLKMQNTNGTYIPITRLAGESDVGEIE